MKTTRGIYVHIPFCLSKCTYCDFYSVSMDTEIMKSYTHTIIDEIKQTALKFQDSIIDTIYIGGGTPSVLPLNLLYEIVNAIYQNFQLDLKEFTIELNPSNDIDFKALKDIGINRISFGVQTLNNDILKLIGRRHDAITALKTLDNANKYFDNISCDLMIGLPKQTQQDVDYAISTIMKNVKHISMYMLKLSATVPMYRSIQNGEFSLPNDDDFVDLYDLAFDLMKKNDFNRYEISNFSKKGYESLHNLKYWQRNEYFGFGPAAHGFINNIRYNNVPDLNKYILGKHFGNSLAMLEEIDNENALFETIMLSFRLQQGLNIQEINKKFNIDFENKYGKQLTYLASFLVIQDGMLRIKEENLLLESAIVREFLN